MNDFLERSKTWAQAHPVAAPTLAGGLARLIAATVALGFHARDDYFHVLDPALRWIRDSGFDWDRSGLPGAGIRSHLIPRAVQGVVEAAQGLGIEEPDSVLRIIYVLLGAYSLLVVPAMYYTARRLLDERGACLAAWLAAIHFAMPYTGTRLLIEAMAMPPLIFGLGLVADRGMRRILLGGFFVGLACWFRFQTGVAAVGLAVAVAMVAWRHQGWRGVLRDTTALAIGGVLAVAVQGLFDVATTGMFLGPVLKNIAVNLCAAKDDPTAEICKWVVSQGLDPHHGLSRSNIFAYAGLWIGLTVPPATLILLAPMVRAGRRLPTVSWAFLAFVVVHSFIPHKEERFMLPVFPLFLLLLAAVPAAMQGDGGPLWKRLQRLWPMTYRALIVVHLAVLPIAITAQSQLNQREAIGYLRADTHARGIVSMGPEIPVYFLGGRNLSVAQRGRPDAGWLNKHITQQTTAPNRFLGFEPDRAQLQIMLAAEGLSCDTPVRFDGWWLDRVIYTLNARRNRRRSPVLLWHCEMPALARAQF